MSDTYELDAETTRRNEELAAAKDREERIRQAGYRAGLEAAKKNYDDLSAEEWVYKSAWELHGEWLTQQVKKGQP